MEDGTYETPNYKASAKKIFINLAKLNRAYLLANFEFPLKNCCINFSGAKLILARFKDGNMSHSNFENCETFMIKLENCNVRSAIFKDSQGASSKFVNCSMVNVNFENVFAPNSTFKACDLSHANLKNMTGMTKFEECNLVDANCENADWSYGTLSNTNMI